MEALLTGTLGSRQFNVKIQSSELSCKRQTGRTFFCK